MSVDFRKGILENSTVNKVCFHRHEHKPLGSFTVNNLEGEFPHL